MIHSIEENKLIPEMLQCNKLALVLFVIVDNELCQRQVQILHDIEKKYIDEIEIFQINIEDSQEIEMRYHISSFPSLLFFNDGKEIERTVGIVESQKLIELIQEFS